jgi:hypothetical protein
MISAETIRICEDEESRKILSKTENWDENRKHFKWRKKIAVKYWFLTQWKWEDFLNLLNSSYTKKNLER